MIYLVYHYNMNKYYYCNGEWTLIEESGGLRACKSVGPNFSKEYWPVAAVEADGIDDVFRMTNHIDSDWTENEGVIPIVPQARSTSVGDIVVDGSGNRFLCAAQGWEKI